MVKFKVGDVIELIDAQSLNAGVGALATVTNIWQDDTMIDVKWNRNTNCGSQSDGGYLPSRFRLWQGNAEFSLDEIHLAKKIIGSLS